MPQSSRAWITYVTEEENVVTKVLVLVGSLKRVCSANKTVVFAPHSLSEDLRQKLEKAFDLLIPLLPSSSSLQLQTEEEALVQALTLKSFEKCVFLSPECLVLKNCDDLFEKFASFGVSNNVYDGKQNTTHPTVGFVPSLALSKSLKNFLLAARNGNGHLLSRYLYKWMQNNTKNVSQFEGKYSVSLDMRKGAAECLEPDATIISFVKKHPLDKQDDFTNCGAIESYAAGVFHQVLAQVEQNSSLQLELDDDPKHGSGEPIAVVGMSCRLPGANNIDEFWKLLFNGENTVRPVPPSRWGRNKSFVQFKDRSQPAGFLNVPIDEFDYKFFGISPREAEFLDPQQRLLHEVTWEALEDATVDPSSLKGSNAGFYVGTWIYDYREIAFRVPDFDFYRMYMGNSVAVSAARLSHFYQTTGPSIGTESACSSSISAIHMACKSLQSGETNLALACAANLIIHPFELMKQNIVLSPTGQCRTFDEKADGFARAEGCCAIILKRLSDAVRDGDDIWALIRGSSVVQEGVSRSMGTPTIQCEAMAMELALKDAGVSPLDVSFVEAHGTGTPVGDPMEVRAISKAYGGSRKQPLYIGSVKTNIGHTESASGLAGLIKVILSMKNELIPAHLNFESLNPEIKLDDIPACIPLSPVAWPRNAEGQPRLAGVSSFGISGTDGHLIVQEPPTVFKNDWDSIQWKLERPLHILKLSARCDKSMDQLLKNYEQMFSNNSEVDFGDVAHTANIGRASFSQRACVIARDSSEALSIIKEKRYKTNAVTAGGAAGMKLCFLFTGQGSQYNGMAKELYDTSPVFQHHFNLCCRILKGLLETVDMYDVVFGSDSIHKTININQTLYSQISIFVVEYCLLKLWETWGVKPDYVIGHSLGEFAAAVAVGSLDLESALELVTKRSILIDNLSEGKMLVVKASAKTVSNMLNEYKVSNTNFWLDIAALNSHEQTVVAGDTENVQEFSKFCELKGVKSTILASTHAFHSRHMESMLEKYASACSKTLAKMKPDKSNHCQYISGVEGKLIDGETLLDSNYWVNHCREKVNFLEACKTAQSEGCGIFLEIGPHPILSALTMMNMEGSSAVSCFPSIRRNEGNWQTMLESLGNLWISNWHGTIDWIGFDKHYNRKRVPVPFYPFIRRPIWAEMEPHMEWILAPLLGRRIPTPSSVTLFGNYVTVKKFSYLPDHSIGNTILFPGAAFLEICLCAGHAAAQGYNDSFSKPHRAVGLKNLEIVAPLAISDVKACNTQTVVKLEEENETGQSETASYGIEVHHWLEEKEGDEQTNLGGKWILHANASFLPFISSKEEKVDFYQIRSAATSKEWNSTELYENIAKLGLRLGSSFQRIHKGWFLEEDSKQVLFEVKMSPKRDEYMIHPTIGDAMIQVIMMLSNKIAAASGGGGWKKRLQIPVKVGEFVWFPKESDGDDAFIYCFINEDRTATALLVNEAGETLARMSGVEFIETSSKFVEGLIQQQSVLMPKLWEEVWRPCPGVLQESIPSKVLEEIPRIVQVELRECIKESKVGIEEQLTHYDYVCKLTVSQFLRALKRLGWAPNTRDRFTMAELLTLLSIKSKFKNYVGFFLGEMTKERCLVKAEEEDNWIVEPELVDALEKVDEAITEEIIIPEEASNCDYRLVAEIGNRLSEILSGKVDPLSLVYPEDPKKPNAEGIYSMVASQMEPAVRYANATLSNSFPLIKSQSPSNSRLRVLEIGAGTGVNTTLFFECIHSSLENAELNLEYFYTDISPAFFTAAKANPKLQNYLKYITFKKLDIEVDPFSQDFSPAYFDAILAAEVLHATKNIRQTMKHLKTLMKPGGFIQICETVMDSPFLMFVFGLLDGYWRFQDNALRKNSPVVSETKWKQILEENGFTDASTAFNYNGVHAAIYAYRQVSQGDDDDDFASISKMDCSKTWIIFGDDFTRDFISKLGKMMKEIERKIVVVDRPKLLKGEESDEELIKQLVRGELKSVRTSQMKLEGIIYLWGIVGKDEHAQSKISLPLLSLCQELLGSVDVGMGSSPPKLFVLTNGLHSSTEAAMLNPSSSTLLGIAKSVPIEHNNLSINVMDLHTNFEDCLSHVFYNLWTSGEKNDFYAFRNGKRVVRRMKAKRIVSNQLLLPNACDRFQLALPSTKQIADLEFTHLEKAPLEDDQVEVHVKAMALNFRDVFSILKPIPVFDELNTVGLDFAGVVTSVGSKVNDFKVGDDVIGFNSHQNLALPSHLSVAQSLIVPLPKGMSYCEGATLPAVYMTSIYCLFNLARIQSGETVLIHTASGGVGLSAIQLAKQANAKIIATAGSERKRTYLRNLGIIHVFNSRTTEFCNQILEVTNGKGVDVVLNSITGPGFKEATLKALGRNGRFIELSKLGVWTKEEVAELRSDVEYHVTDIKALTDDFIEDIMKDVRIGLNGDSAGGGGRSIKPLPFERFDALDIRAALHYLQQAKHIGKVVCVMPEVKRENSQLKIVTQLFNNRSTYIVTGGLGGIGFEVVKWMLRNGARYIAIISRSSSPKPEIAEKIKSFNEKDGQHIRTFSVDVSNYAKCCEFFETIQNKHSGFPVIRGVMHAAGLLDDATIENQTWAKFQSTYNSKVDGSWNLHLLTKTLELEHFVMFSSISSVFGAPGQANYSASNNFKDALAHYRNGQGLPAISINWGHWAEVGMATEAEFPGVRPISTSEGLLLLGSVLRSSGTTQVVGCNIESFSLLAHMFPNLKQYADDPSLFGPEQKTQISITSDEFWTEVDAAEDRVEKVNVFKTHIKIFVRNILKMGANEPIGDFTDFQSLGVDSLMMLEMKNGIQNLLGSRLIVTASHIKDCNNVQLLANRFMDLIESKEEEEEMPTLEELSQLIQEDCQLLTDHIIPPKSGAVKERDIQTVLLTGPTGTLGPYILKDLLKVSTIQKIYCLVRPKGGNLSATERLNTILDKRGIRKEEFIKVEAIEGDVAKENLGLNEKLYANLSLEVDAVIHCAVKSDHIAKYWKAPPARLSNIRNINVLGTKIVLEFAANLRAKHVFHASSLLVVTTTKKEDGTLTEDWQDDTAYDCLSYNSGYMISKFVSEQLVKHAGERWGLPCKSLRFALVSGDGETGELDMLSNHYMLRLLAFMKLGCMPDAPLPSPLIPPDVCSQALVRICLNEDAKPGVYNVVPPHPQLEQVFVKVAAEIGVNVETVSLEAFFLKLNEGGDNDGNSIISPLRRIYTENESRSMEIASGIPCIRQWMDELSPEFFVSRKMEELLPSFLEEIEPTEEIMKRDLGFAKRSGAFEMIGIQSDRKGE